MGTVIVACRIPNSLLILDREIKGPNKVLAHLRPDVVGPSDKPTMSGSYALTYDVDADAWNSWYSTHSDMDMVKNGQIFAAPDIHGIRQRVRQVARNPGAAIANPMTFGNHQPQVDRGANRYQPK
jgi:hypothetical protein